MKKLLYILLFVPLALFGQSTSYIEQDVPLELFEGWNMFGYSCYEPIDVATAFTSINDKIVIVKDNSGNVYMPEFGFNGIGSLERNRGYQIKLTESISDFQFCPFIVPLVEGCMDETAFNYNSSANIDDGSCEYNNCFYPPDSAFVFWLQQNTVGVMNGDCLDIDAASLYEGSFEIDNTISDLNGIQYFTNLFYLSIYNNEYLSSCHYISNLSKLQYLHFINTSLISLPDLSELSILRVLDIHNNDNLTSLPDFTGLTDLIELYIGLNFNLTSLPDFSGLTNLNNLHIWENSSLTNLTDLSELTNLILLDINNNDNLISLPNLSGLSNLEELNLYENDALASIPELTGLTNLLGIYIENCNLLTNLPDLSGLSNLASLVILDNDNLTSLPDLSALSNLNTLNIDNNDNLECVVAYPEQLNINEEWPPNCPSEACPYDVFIEYNPYAINYNVDLCLNIIVEGCTDNIAVNYNSDANVDDNSCEFIYGCIDQEADNYNSEATADDGSCIYYGCTDPTAGNYDEIANTDDGTCLIGGCMNYTAENYNPDAAVDDGSCVIPGCVLDAFPNYNSVATSDDGSCDMNSLDVFGCTDESTWTYQDFATVDNGTCDSSELKVGSLGLGGIVFYIDETGQHGLVAALEDLGEFEWGCNGTDISGADGQSTGTGLLNTLEIVSGCSATPIAASEALAYESGGYSDWFLPSKDELVEMYNTIGNGGPEGNIGGFSNDFYWSSSEGNLVSAWDVNFSDGGSDYVDVSFKSNTFRVRVIRAF